MSTSPGSALIGRTDELESMSLRARAVSSGCGALILVDGDAGVGKTRLLAELLRAPSLPAGYAAVCAGALDYARAPYAPIRDVLVALDTRYPKVLAQNIAIAQTLRPLLELEPFEEGSADPARRRRLLDAIVHAFERYSANAPLIVAVEDAHWIDRASADVLVHTMRSLQTLRALFVVTYRGSEAGERAESRNLIAQLSRSASTLQLRGLSTSDAMLLIQDVVPSNLPIAVRRSICELGQGNPLLLIELARHAAENPAALDGALPVSLRALVNDRLARFDRQDRDILQVCAAMDRFDPRVVSDIARAPLQSVLETLRKARGAAIVVESPSAREQFLFRHALIRRAITDELLGIELAELHARIARRLETQQATADLNARLAYHYWMAGERENAQRFNTLAAQAAAGVYAYDDAAMLYERAIDAKPVEAATRDLHAALAQTYAAAGRYRQAVDIYRSLFSYAREHENSTRAVSIAIELSRCCFHALDDEGCTGAVRDALAITDPQREPGLAFELHGLLAWYLVHQRNTEPAHEALKRAQTLLAHGTPVARVRFHEARAAYEVHARGGGAWREAMEDGLRAALELEPRERIRRVANAMALAVASEIDAYDVALDLLERSDEIIAANPSLAHLPVLAPSAWITYTCGDLAHTRRILDAMLPLVGDAPYLAFWAAAAGIPLGLRTGDEMLVRSCSRPRLLQDAFASKRQQVFGPVAAAIAEHMLAQGRDGEACTLIERTLDRLQDAGNNFQLLMLAARAGSDALAQRAQAMIEPWESRSTSAHACSNLMRAFRAKGSQRVELARAAASEFEVLHWRLHQAQALELAGDVQAALQIYRSCGAAADVVRAEPRTSRGIPGGLSKRELEVADLISRGNSNRSIAERLVLSERTVENHIASIFAKLDVRSRAEVAAFITRENAQSAS